MTTLIPAISTCVSRRFSGARRTAERLAQKHAVNRLPGNDDAQRTHHRAKKRTLNCKGVGIQAQERTTILKINHRNTRQILQMATAQREGHARADMAILCRHYSEIDECADVLRQRGLPHQVRKGAGSFDPAADTIKVLTRHASKGLECPGVALVGAGHMPTPGEDEREEAKLFYVGTTRATQRLIIGLGGTRRFGQFGLRM